MYAGVPSNTNMAHRAGGPSNRYMAGPPPAPGLPDQSSPHLPEVLGTPVPKDVLSNTLSTLYLKMEGIRQAIELCQCTQELHELFYALHECIRAIESTQILNKKQD